MTGTLRYFRLFLAMARFGLLRELAFRTNFLAKVFVEVLWLGILLAFYATVFSKTRVVATWTETQYMFFVGCFFAMEGLIETFFLSNCNNFSDLIRTGDLDFYLLKPIDEQFLVSCRDIDWSTVPNFLMGTGVMLFALHREGWPVDALRVASFLVLFLCGLAIAYSFMLMLTVTAVWLTRNQSLYEMWWLFTSFMRYPREIFSGRWSSILGWVFSYLIPILLAVQIPASVMIRAVVSPWMAVFTVLVAVLLLLGSRRFFRLALRRYRSASS